MGGARCQQRCPEKVPRNHEQSYRGPTTRCEEQRIRQLHEGEPPHVSKIYEVREDAQDGGPKGEPVDNAEDKLKDHNAVDQAREKALRDHCVLFNKLGQIVQS